MFDPTSRYATIDQSATLTVAGPGGEPRQIRYVRRRFLPPPDAGTTLVEHIVTQGDRVDNVTARYLGDPTQFWRICDANRVLRPNELTDEIGRIIRIAIPGL
jgi:hypothetical protein